MPVIFIAAYLFVGTSIAIADPQAALIGIAVMAVFITLYFAVNHRKKPLIKKED